ncbi:MAG: hypothetical protein HZA16_10035 [Nitrospirae bacterium]|nr:hypothetical protein [Nitrospirota bacterium]
MKNLIAALLSAIILCSAALPVRAEEKLKTAPVAESTVGEKGGVLIDRGRLIFEPGFAYSHITTQRLDIAGLFVVPALAVGIIQVEKIKRDILVPSASFKYGLTDSVELDIKIPYSVRYDEYTIGESPDFESKRVNEAGFGDIEGMALIHLVREKGTRPDVIAGIKIKSRTGKDPYGVPTETVSGSVIPTELPLGSGHWALEPGFTFVRTSDPAILFANISYFWHMKRDVGSDLGKVDPSDSINYSAGFAYALNDELVLSSAFEQKFFTKAKIGGEKQEGTNINVASLLLGASYVLSSRTTFGFILGVGLTENSPDVQVTLRMPTNIL